MTAARAHFRDPALRPLALAAVMFLSLTVIAAEPEIFPERSWLESEPAALGLNEPKSWKREPRADHYEVLKPFLGPLASAVPAHPTAPSGERRSAVAPYPPSPVIREIRWAPTNSILRQARGSDNWPLTWGDDDHLYTAYGDGWGFDPRTPRKLSLGLARIEGIPPEFQGINIRSAAIEQTGDGAAGKKASGILMVKGVLYLWTRNAGNSQLAWSPDRGANWTWAGWKFTHSFGCPTFLNFGRNYRDARDGYVYVYSHDADSAYVRADRMVLARAPLDRLTERDAYEFFERVNDRGQPLWTSDLHRRGAVFERLGQCYRSSVSYHPGLRRYLWCQTGRGEDPRFRGGLAIYDAPEPWGPWTTAYFAEEWDAGPGESSSLPVKWMSADGRTVHLVFSGDDCFSVRQGTLVLQ